MYNNDGFERLLNDVLQALNDEDQEKERAINKYISVENRIKNGCKCAFRSLQYRDGEDITFFIDGILRAITSQERV